MTELLDPGHSSVLHAIFESHGYDSNLHSFVNMNHQSSQSMPDVAHRLEVFSTTTQKTFNPCDPHVV